MDSHASKSIICDGFIIPIPIHNTYWDTTVYS